MKSRLRAILLLLILSIAFAAAWHFRPEASSSAPLTAQVYVWQRAWTGDVQEALRKHGPAFSRVVTLSRQISWNGLEGKVDRIGVDWDSLRASGSPVGLAIRIGSFSGSFEESSGLIEKTVLSMLEEAHREKVVLAEIQLDFDAATSKLGGYRKWVSAARAAAGQVPVTITALPAWLDSAEFAPLAKQAGGFVLQVHGLEKPKMLTDPAVVCDPAKARAAISKAAKLNVPFRVALPTYGYAMAFDEKGKFIALAAEDATAGWAQGKTIRIVEAQCDPLADMVKEYSAKHPPCLEGFIWYRMPVESDRLNWSWSTLEQVMRGQIPSPSAIEIQIANNEAGLYEIVLKNTGQQDAHQAFAGTISWSEGNLIAADALAGVEMTRSDNRLDFAGNNTFTRLKPGQTRTIGWLRISNEKDLKAHVK